MGMVPHPIRPEIQGDEERFKADLLDMVAKPGKWGMKQANADELYDRMSIAGKGSRGRKKGLSPEPPTPKTAAPAMIIREQ